MYIGWACGDIGRAGEIDEDYGVEMVREDFDACRDEG